MMKLKSWFSSSNSSNNGKIRTKSLSIKKKLDETTEKLDAKERVLQSKISTENERATKFTKSRNKKAALECLKRKNFYEAQMDQLGSFRLQVNEQMKVLEGVTEMNEL